MDVHKYLCKQTDSFLKIQYVCGLDKFTYLFHGAESFLRS